MITIGEEITLLIFPYLGAAELLVAGLVSKTWFNFSSSDFFWKVLYENSSFVPSTLAAKAKSLKISYLVSAGDVYRTFITTAEVCGQKMWDFRFKEAAGDEWMSICPWHRGNKASKVTFHVNGRLERIIVPHTASGSQRDGGPSLNTEHDNATELLLLGNEDLTLEWTLSWSDGTDPLTLINCEFDPSFSFEAEMKKIEYARNRSTGRNWAYHKKEEMYLKKLEMKQSLTEFLNRVKKVETPPLHFIYSNEVEEGSEQVRMKLAERYEDHSYLFNYGAVINEDDIVEMERRKNFNQKRPHTRSSTLKSDNSNNELNSKINLYFLHQNCGNCIRLRVNGTLVPEYFVRRSAFPNPPSSSSSSSSSSFSTPSTKAATTSLHHSLPSFYITPPPSSSSATSTSTSCFPSSSFPSNSTIPSLTLNSSSINPIISSSSSSSSTTTTTTSYLSSSSSSSSSSSTSSLEKRKRRQSSRIINKNINLKYEDEDDIDNSYDASTDHDDNHKKITCCDDDDIKFNNHSTQKDSICSSSSSSSSNDDDTYSDKPDDIKKNQNTVRVENQLLEVDRYNLIMTMHNNQ